MIAYLARLRAMDSGILVIADAEEASYSVVAMESDATTEYGTKSVEALDSELALDYVDAPDSVEMVPNSVDAPDSLCVCCGMLHADDDSEACFQARRRTRTCSCCGLLHEDYDLAARIFHDLDKFDCQIYIPDVDKLVMNGNTPSWCLTISLRHWTIN